MTVKNKTGDIRTKQHFGSVPHTWNGNLQPTAGLPTKQTAVCFFNEIYEIQILDSNDNDTYVNGQTASVQTTYSCCFSNITCQEWNNETLYTNMPEFDAQGNKTKSGTFTVIHNGVLVQDHVTIEGSTEWKGWPKTTHMAKDPSSYKITKTIAVSASETFG